MLYYLTIGTTMAIVTIGVLGTHLLTGMNGMFSLGQAAFMEWALTFLQSV